MRGSAWAVLSRSQRGRVRVLHGSSSGINPDAADDGLVWTNGRRGREEAAIGTRGEEGVKNPPLTRR